MGRQPGRPPRSGDGVADRDRARDAAVDRAMRPTRPASTAPRAFTAVEFATAYARAWSAIFFLEVASTSPVSPRRFASPPRVVVVVVVVVVARRRFGEDALGEALEAGPQGRVLQRASRGGVIIFRRGFHASVAATRGGAVSVCGPLKLAQGASTRVAARKRRGGHHARGNRRAIRRVNPQGGGGAVASFRRGFREEFSAQLSLAVLNGTEKSTGQFGATPPPSVRWRARGWADGSHGPRRGRRPARAMERTHGEAEAKGRGGGGEATVRPLNPSPPTHAPRAARDFRPCAEKRPVAKSPSRPPRLLPSPTLIDPTRVPPRHAGCATRRYPRGPPTSRRTASTTKERTPPTSSSPRMPPSANQPLAPRAGA